MDDNKNNIDLEILEMDIGDTVLCDGCNEDYSDSDEQGGLLFAGKAFCPTCAPNIESSARIHGEESHITARCPTGMSFKEWCLTLRNGDNRVLIFSWD